MFSTPIELQEARLEREQTAEQKLQSELQLEQAAGQRALQNQQAQLELEQVAGRRSAEKRG